MFDLDLGDEPAKIKLDITQLNDPNFVIDINNYTYGKHVVFDITNTTNQDIAIDKLSIICNKFIQISFAVKDYTIKIKDLILKCCGIEYSNNNHVKVDNLKIITTNSMVCVNSKSVKNLYIVDEDQTNWPLQSQVKFTQLSPNKDKVRIILSGGYERLFIALSAFNISYIDDVSLLPSNSLDQTLIIPTNITELLYKTTDEFKWLINKSSETDSYSINMAILALMMAADNVKFYSKELEQAIYSDKVNKDFKTQIAVCLIKSFVEDNIDISAESLHFIIDIADDLLVILGDQTYGIIAQMMLSCSKKNVYLKDPNIVCKILKSTKSSDIIHAVIVSISDLVDYFNDELKNIIEKSSDDWSDERKYIYISLIFKLTEKNHKPSSETITSLKNYVELHIHDDMGQNTFFLLIILATKFEDYREEIFKFSIDLLKIGSSISDKIIELLINLLKDHKIAILGSSFDILCEILSSRDQPYNIKISILKLLELSLPYNKKMINLNFSKEIFNEVDTHQINLAYAFINYMSYKMLYGLYILDDFIQEVKTLNNIFHNQLKTFLTALENNISLSDSSIKNREKVQKFLLDIKLENNDSSLVMDRFLRALDFESGYNLLKILDIINFLIKKNAQVHNNILQKFLEILSCKSKCDDELVKKIINSIRLLAENKYYLDINIWKKIVNILENEQDINEDDLSFISKYIKKCHVSVNQSLGKDPDQLIIELFDNNKDIKNSFFKAANLKKIEKIYEESCLALESKSRILDLDQPIKDWAQDEILSWSLKFKSLDNKQDISYLPEIIAVMQTANKIHTKQILRAVQIMSIASFIISDQKGLLLQISTGEGKSTITSITAAIKALQGETVDVITSSPILAERDVEERRDFFRMLGLKAAFNLPRGFRSKHVVENYEEYKKDCYNSDIIFGNAATFQGDFILDALKGENNRQNRKFGVVLVDEVDSMLLDEKEHVLMISHNLAAAEYLGNILASIWYFANYIEQRVRDGEFRDVPNIKQFKQEMVYQYIISNITEYVKIPAHLQDFYKTQLHQWIDSAFVAMGKVEDQDYVVAVDSDGEKIIAPVDYYNTGVVQVNTSWSEGLHQFIQLKHKIRMTAENLMTCFISNLGYFKLYGNKIYGLTGTLGSDKSRDLLIESYDINCGFVPTYKEKIFEEKEGLITNSEEDWLQEITLSIKKHQSQNRAILVICRTIQDVYNIKSNLIKSGCDERQIRIYSRSDNHEKSSIERIADEGDIIIATNLAGRGTDIKISQAVEEAGGLHVCVTFLPSNLRVEQQAFGRTARSGQPGTAQLILKPYDLQIIGASSGSKLSDIKELRDEKEALGLLHARLEVIDTIITKDSLFKNFCDFYNSLRTQGCDIENDPNRNKLNQLEDNWGIFLKDILQLTSPSYPTKNFKLKMEKLGFQIGVTNFAEDSLFKAITNIIISVDSVHKLKSIVYGYLYYLKTQELKCNITSLSFIDFPDHQIMQAIAELLGCNIFFIEKEGEIRVFKVNNNLSRSIFLGREESIEINFNDKKYAISAERYCLLLNSVDSYSKEILQAFQSTLIFKSPYNLDDIKIFCSKHKDSYIKEYIEFVESKHYEKASIYSANRKDLILAKYHLFQSENMAKFSEGDKIMNNPAHLIRQVFKENGENLSLLNVAVEIDPNFNAIAHYNKAYFIIKGNYSNYRQIAIDELTACISNIYEVIIPQLEMLYLCDDPASETDLSKQIKSKIDFWKSLASSSESMIKKINESLSNDREIKLSNVTNLHKSPPDGMSKSDIAQLSNLGVIIFFDVVEEKPSGSFFGAIFSAVVGVLEVVAGAACAITGNFAAAVAFFKAGISDIVDSFKIAKGDKAFNLGNFLTAKGLDLVAHVIMDAVMYVATAGKNALEGLKEYTKNFVESTKSAWTAGAEVVAGEALKDGASSVGKDQFKSFCKYVARDVVVNSGLKAAAAVAIEEIMEGFAEEAEAAIADKVQRFFDEHRAAIIELLLMDQIDENNLNYNRLMNAASFVMGDQSNHISRAVAILGKIVQERCNKGLHGQSGEVLSAVGTVMEVMAIPAESMAQINKLGDKLEDTLEKSIKLGKRFTFESYFASKTGSILNAEDRENLLDLLRSAGVISDIGVNLEASKDLDYGKFNDYKTAIERILSKISKKQELEEKCLALESKLRDEIAREVRKGLFQKIKSGVALPVLSKPVAELSAKIVNKVEETLEKYKNNSREEKLRKIEEAGLRMSQEAAEEARIIAEASEKLSAKREPKSWKENLDRLEEAYDKGELKLPKQGLDKKLVGELAREIEEDLPKLPKKLRDKLITLSYHQTKYLKEHPEENKRENIELASAGVIGQGIRLAPKIYKHAEKAFKMAKDLLLMAKKQEGQQEVRKQERSKIVVTDSGSGDNNDRDPDEDSSEDDERVSSVNSEKVKVRVSAKEVIEDNPYKAKDYVREVEEITGRKIPDKQITRLREELQKREFNKLDTEATRDHRDIFKNQAFKDKLRQEWERETGQEWPKYEEDIFNSQGDKIKSKGRPYDIHHIVQNNHGGPHEWWNIHPASKLEHEVIHRSGGLARQIFNAVIKK